MFDEMSSDTFKVSTFWFARITNVSVQKKKKYTDLGSSKLLYPQMFDQFEILLIRGTMKLGYEVYSEIMRT